MKTNNTQQNPANDLIQVLVECRNGAVAIDLNEKFSELVTAVCQHGKKGKLTIDLEVKPGALDGSDVVEVQITHAMKMKKPERYLGASTFFVGTNGRLQREDPAQQAMFESEPEPKREKAN